MSLKVNLTKIEHNSTRIAEEINFEVLNGQIAGLYGSSGSGKTTILRSIAGLHSEYSGMATLSGISVSKVKIGFVQQESAYFRWMTTKQNILFGNNSDNSRDLIDLLGLSTEALNAYPHELSGGMKQRMALGRVLLGSPEMVLLDEPFSALDFSATEKLLTLLIEISNELNVPVIIVSHNPLELASVCDSIVVLDSSIDSPTQIGCIERIALAKRSRSLEEQGRIAQKIRGKIA